MLPSVLKKLLWTLDPEDAEEVWTYLWEEGAVAELQSELEKITGAENEEGLWPI